MTEQELIDAIVNSGATMVCVASKPIDCGAKVGVAVQYYRDGELRRSAALLEAGRPVEDAFPALLDWATRP